MSFYQLMMTRIFLFGLLLICSAAHCQHQFAVETDIGASFPAHENLKKIFDAGLDFHLGPSFNIKKNKLYLKPYAGLTWYFKKIDDTNSVTEHLRVLRIGLEPRYIVVHKGLITISGLVDINLNWMANYYSVTFRDPLTNSTKSETTDDILTGKSISPAVGFMIEFDGAYIKFNYHIFKTRLKVNQQIIDEGLAEGIIVVPDPAFNLSSFNISLGYAFLRR